MLAALIRICPLLGSFCWIGDEESEKKAKSLEDLLPFHLLCGFLSRLSVRENGKFLLTTFCDRLRLDENVINLLRSKQVSILPNHLGFRVTL
jgi:hypothetical protein